MRFKRIFHRFGAFSHLFNVFILLRSINYMGLGIKKVVTFKLWD